MTTVLYRYRDICDESGRMYLQEDEYWVLKETPCGWWVARADGGFLNPDVIAYRLANKHSYGVRFVLSGSGKRYAYPSKADALGSYRSRKARQAEIARANLERAALGLQIANRLLTTGSDLPIDRWGLRLMGNPFESPTIGVSMS
ncbi:hypothetical protein D3C77_49030 [compost metagenome]